MIFLFLELVHKKWFYIFTSENHDAWHLNFMCYITTSFIFWYVFFILRKTFLLFTKRLTLFLFSLFRKILFTPTSLLFVFHLFRKILISFARVFLKFFFPFPIQLSFFSYIWKKIFDQSFISFKNYDLHEPHFYDSLKNHLKIA